MTLVNYWYIDKQGIDSLLAQISSDFVQEEHVKIIRKGMGTATGNVGFSKVLKQLFNADVALSGGIETTREIEKIEIQPYEKKIQQLKRYVEENEVLLSNKQEISTKYEQGKANFFFGNLEFDTQLNVANWEHVEEVIKKWGYIQFYKGPKNTYNYSDNYFKTSQSDNFYLVMSLGTSKMQTSYLGVTSHLATFLRILDGRNIPLGVFGHILKQNSETFQIKPYAVWVG